MHHTKVNSTYRGHDKLEEPSEPSDNFARFTAITTMRALTYHSVQLSTVRLNDVTEYYYVDSVSAQYEVFVNHEVHRRRVTVTLSLSYETSDHAGHHKSFPTVVHLYDMVYSPFALLSKACGKRRTKLEQTEARVTSVCQMR